MANCNIKLAALLLVACFLPGMQSFAQTLPAGLKDAFIDRAMTKDLFVFINNYKRGVVDEKGTIILPAVYSQVYETDNQYFVVEKDDKTGVVKRNNQVVLPFQFKRIQLYSSNLYVAEKNGFIAIVDNQNRFVRDTFGTIYSRYQSLDDNPPPPQEMLADVRAEWYFRNDKGTISIINGKDTMVTSFTELSPLWGNSRYYLVKKDIQWGLVDENLKTILKPVYSQISADQATGYITTNRGDTFQLLRPMADRLDTLLTFPIGRIDHFDEQGIAVASNGLESGLIDKEGKYVYGPIQGTIERYSSELFTIKHHLADGMEIINRQYKSLLPAGCVSNGYSGGIILLQNKEKKMGAMHATGYQLVPVQYDEVFFGNSDAEMDQGFKVRTGEKWGFLNMRGKTIIPFEYDQIGLFKEGLSVAKRGGKTGVINMAGKVIVPFLYDGADYEYNDYHLLRVEKDGLYGMVDKKGKVVIPLVYQSIHDDFANGPAPAMKGGKWGYIGLDGKEVIAFEYDRAEPFYSNTATVIKSGETYKIDKAGKRVN